MKQNLQKQQELYFEIIWINPIFGTLYLLEL